MLPRPANPPGTGWWGRMIDEVKELALYHLVDDPGETKNVAALHPDVVRVIAAARGACPGGIG